MNAFHSHETPIKGATDVWLTPLWIIQDLGEFDLDPCGFQGHQTAKEIRTKDGLKGEWKGRVWLNPPYSEISAWVSRMRFHGNGIALLFARTDTKWFHENVFRSASSIMFFEGRLKFLRPDGSSPPGNAGAASCLVSYGANNQDQISKALLQNKLRGEHVLLKSSEGK